MASSIGLILSFVLVWSSCCWMSACANNKCNLITLGGVNEVVLKVKHSFLLTQYHQYRMQEL
jgi:hypothetical protein